MVSSRQYWYRLSFLIFNTINHIKKASGNWLFIYYFFIQIAYVREPLSTPVDGFDE